MQALARCPLQPHLRKQGVGMGYGVITRGERREQIVVWRVVYGNL